MKEPFELLKRENCVPEENNERDEDSEPEYEIVTSTVEKFRSLPESFLYPVIDNEGNHLFSVSQREINQNKELYF